MSDEEKVIKKIEGILSIKKPSKSEQKKIKASEFDFSKYIVKPDAQVRAFKRKKEKERNANK